MSTARDIVTRALGHSAKNRPTTANMDNELRLAVGFALQRYMGEGVSANPDYFGAQAPMTGVGGVFTRPADADRIYRIETATKGEVLVVPVSERTIDHGKPRLYRLGRTYITVGGTGDPGATDTLTAWYVAAGVIPATLDDALDARWPSAHDALLELELASYLAIKDGRNEELPGLQQLIEMAHTVFMDHVKSETMDVVATFHPPRFTEAQVMPLGAGTPR